MNQSVKPPRILFVRPKSAGSVRSRCQNSGSLAPTTHTRGKNPSASLTTSIAISATAPPYPVRPLHSAARRPSSAIGSRRCFAASVSALPLPKSAREVDPLNSLWQQDSLEPESASGADTGGIYRVVVARKDAEDAAQQLARRIAHFRVQEERMLHEMQNMRTHLETSLVQTHEPSKFPAAESAQASQAPRSLRPQDRATMANLPMDTNNKRAGTSTSSTCKRKLKVPRSREQLEFLAKQKRALEVHKLEVARQQKERRKQAVAAQKAKEVAQEHERRCRIERIRAEEQQALEQRIEKQRRIQEAATKQHYERLMSEKQRQREALGQIAGLQEEERNLRLRLEALHFHREYMEQELRSNLPPREGI